MIIKNNTLSIWLKYLEQFDKKVRNLYELKSIAKRLDLLSFKTFIFTVAGTNGKGTTCAMLEGIFLNAGYQVGLYTSPHLISYLERVRINGCFLTEEEHISSFKKIEFARKKTILTYFEFITLSSLILFKKHSLDILILEVGLGGRLDATNIIDSNLSIITNIGIDHTNILGKNRSSIAREKSGIFRKNKISVIGEKNIPDSMNQIAQEKNAILKKINIDWFWKKNNYSWSFIHSDVQFFDLPITQIPLSNAAIALSALYYSGFKISEKIIRKSLLTINLPGRFQVISSFPNIILDVAHNPDAALYLSKKIDEIPLKGKIYAIIGMFRDKDISGIVCPLKNKIHYWYAAPLRNVRTATINELKKALPKNNTFFSDSIDTCYKELYKIVKKEDTILVFGSFLAVAEFIFSKNIDKKIGLQNVCFL
ncbi:MAG: bifunctional tetrahydrofolate synthase/dihydrofolate synthase [Buchnera aphidicola (Brevicoryne brassicae)]|uniref:Dihydrofolate synthase/folylpolyglutamate synthase n=1 Tax=Buchnera aphidicola (Brevicoryne brassicae) TaxID=911343 RepID=A0AAJ5TXR7_9GAMM|nr:bifunctional tetrahydrofolate synthase/dihydrofolate synthase [Buchnera aphidicola]QCI19745.1 bifunctional tetrahydrofolate synthase/dihydrofolate synthase [Buchnera aphidicola (Brevicoryne brassicae)]WAI19115.1 MAG: bifunctional tetrahydrofolate synthase/dihydrofolate synthase [Buchnera aphidicola (Brevicoryne brassicae)]